MLRHLFFLTLILSNLTFSKAQVAKNGNIDYKIRVMTYNTHHCNPPATPGVINVEGIAKVIKDQNIDIAFLQEIDINVNRSGNTDQAKLLSEKSGLTYYSFYKAINLSKGEYGVLILSKFPLDSTVVHKLALKPNTEQRVIGTAIARLPGDVKLMIASTHLDLDKNYRKIQNQQIDSIFNNQKLPVIFGGDFNSTPDSDELKIMFDNYLCTTSAFEPTFPNIAPNETIDYIFTSKKHKIIILSHQVINSLDFSDHLPVVAEFVINIKELSSENYF